MTILPRATRLACALLLLAAVAAPLAPPAASGAPAPVSRAGSAAIRAHDVDETVRWYRDLLDFRVIADRTLVAGRSVVLERQGMLLEITEEADPPRAQAAAVQDPETTAGVGAPVLSLLVDDVDREMERLRARGAFVFAEPEDDVEGRFRTAWISDRERRIVELREPLAGGPGIMP